MRIERATVLAAVLMMLCYQTTARADDRRDLSSTYGQPDEMYDPTPYAVVEQMLDELQVGAGDVLIDLGCGDGRIPIAAARRGARAIGVDIDPQRIRESRANAARANVEVEWREENLFTTDLDDVTVVALYLSPRINARLWPRLRREALRARIVSYAYEGPVREARKVAAVVRDPRDTVERDVLYIWGHP